MRHAGVALALVFSCAAAHATPAASARFCALADDAGVAGSVALPVAAFDAASLRAKTAGVPVAAEPDVADEAVARTAELLERIMSEASPAARGRLARARVFVVVIPRARKLTDLPQFASLRGVRLPDGRVWDDVRGVGFVWQQDGSAAAAIGEENVTPGAPDRYPKGYLVAHEFAHAFHEFALGDDAQAAITRSFRRRKDARLPFASRYASTTRYEYFAVSAGPFFSLRLDSERDWAWLKRQDGEIVSLVEGAFGAPRPLWPIRTEARAP